MSNFGDLWDANTGDYIGPATRAQMNEAIARTELGGTFFIDRVSGNINTGHVDEERDRLVEVRNIPDELRPGYRDPAVVEAERVQELADRRRYPDGWDELSPDEQDVLWIKASDRREQQWKEQERKEARIVVPIIVLVLIALFVWQYATRDNCPPEAVPCADPDRAPGQP